MGGVRNSENCFLAAALVLVLATLVLVLVTLVTLVTLVSGSALASIESRSCHS